MLGTEASCLLLLCTAIVSLHKHGVLQKICFLKLMPALCGGQQCSIEAQVDNNMQVHGVVLTSSFCLSRHMLRVVHDQTMQELVLCQECSIVAPDSAEMHSACTVADGRGQT